MTPLPDKLPVSAAARRAQAELAALASLPQPRPLSARTRALNGTALDSASLAMRYRMTVSAPPSSAM